MRTKLILLLFTLFHENFANENLIVTTKNGKVEGAFEESDSGKLVEIWRSIPYAKPPLDDLRFLPPQPIGNWDGVLDTKSLPNACYQMNDGSSYTNNERRLNVPMSEDCLYLTIVTPHPRPKNASVLFWIYGGGFNYGSTTLEMYQYGTFTSETDVIIVAPQYRLGAFGFLSSGNNEVIGNAGLHDQYLALEWVHDNIVIFGGNPSKITLIGQSAGSASVGYHLMSPMSKPLFSQAIMLSGVPTSFWALQEKRKTSLNTLNLANDVGCLNHKNNISIAIKCLRKVDVNKITKNSISYDSIIFAPTVDGQFIKETPHHFFIKSNKRIDKNILIGSTKDEGTLFLFMLLPDLFPLNKTRPKMTNLVFNSVVKELYKSFPVSLSQLINYEYTNWKEFNNEMSNVMALNNLFSDSWFTCDINKFTDYIVTNSKNKVYRYLFSHHFSKNELPEWAGAVHTDDLYFVFGYGFNSRKKFTNEENILSKRIMSYFGNFVKTGYVSIILISIYYSFIYFLLLV